MGQVMANVAEENNMPMYELGNVVKLKGADGGYYADATVTVELDDDLIRQWQYITCEIDSFEAVTGILLTVKIDETLISASGTYIRINGIDYGVSYKNVNDISLYQKASGNLWTFVLTDSGFQLISIDANVIENAFVPLTTSGSRVYVTDSSGSQTTLTYGNVVIGDIIVKRDSNGHIDVPQTPSSSTNAVSKKYVDDRSFYTHTITLKLQNDDISAYVVFSLRKNTTTPITVGTLLASIPAAVVNVNAPTYIATGLCDGDPVVGIGKTSDGNYIMVHTQVYGVPSSMTFPTSQITSLIDNLSQ